MKKHYEPSPEKWFRRIGNALAGFSQEGLNEIRENHIKTIVLPSEKDGQTIERLVADCLCCLKELPEVETLVIPGELKIQGLTTTSGRDCWDFPNTETIKRLVFTGKTPINFYRYQRVFDESLESITIQDSDRFKSVDGVIYSKDGKDLIYYPRSKKNKRFIVPASVKDIWSSAFRDVKHLDEPVLPDGLEDISKMAFKNSSIKKIEIPGGVSYIFDEAFASSKLESIVLHEGIRWIGNDAFRDCSPSEVKFPVSLESIHKCAFLGSKSRFTFQTDKVQIDAGSFYGIKYTQLIAAGKHTRKRIINSSYPKSNNSFDYKQITREDLINMIKIFCGGDYPVEDNLSVEDLIIQFDKLYE